MTNSYLHNAKGRRIVTSPVIVCIKIFLISFMRGSYFGPPQSNQNAPRGTDPLVIPGGRQRSLQKQPRHFLEVSLQVLSYRPYRGKKHRTRQGHTERNCHSHTGIVCPAGFAVAIVYKKMLVCCSAGMRVAFTSAVIIC